MKNFNKTLALFLALVMVFTLNPIKSNAKWKDGSGDLPGMTDDNTIVALGAVAAVGIGVLVYVLIKKKKRAQAVSTMEYRNNMKAVLWENQTYAKVVGEENTALGMQSNETSSFSILPQNTLTQQIENARNTIPVDLVVTPLNNNPNFAMNHSNGIQVGVRIRF